MNNLLNLSLMLLFTLPLTAQSSNKQLAFKSELSQGVFKFKNEIINYGTINQNSDGKRFFTFKNIGTTPIIISKIKSSCGCTVPKASKKPIMPRESTDIIGSA